MSFVTGTAANFRALLDALDAFLTDQGHAWGLVFSGDGNGVMSGWEGGASSVHETITVTMLDSLDFDVVGSVTGHIGYGTVGSPFSSAYVGFSIEAGSQDFQAGDAWTLSTSPAWTQKRRDLLDEISTTGTGLTGNNSFHRLADGILDKVTGGEGTVYYSDSASLPIDLVFEHESPITVVEYGIVLPALNAYPTSWTLDYWEESSGSWVTADSQSSYAWSPYVAGTIEVFTLAASKTAARWRIQVTARFSTGIEISQILFRSTNGGYNRLEETVVWQMPGDDGTRTALFGLRPLQRADQDYFTWELFTMDSWSATAELADQTNLERNAYLPVWNDPMDYWFSARGSHVRGVVKVGTQYESFGCGFLDPWFPPNEWPLPMFLGCSLTKNSASGVYTGPSNTSSLRHSVATRSHSSYVIPGAIPAVSGSPTLWDQLAHSNMQLRVRLFDGTYRGFYANNDGSFTSIGLESAPVPPGYVLPYYRGFQSVALSLDDQPILWDVIIGTLTDMLGELPGVKAVSGDSVSAETIVRRGAIDYLVVPDIFRSGFSDFYAFALD